MTPAQTDHARRAAHTRDMFGPLIEVFESFGQTVPVFFLALDPHDWAVQFFHGAKEPADEKLAERLQADRRLAASRCRYAGLSPEDVHRALCDDLRSLKEDPDAWSEEDLFEAALAILEGNRLDLGIAESGNWLPPAAGTRERRPLVRFQDALDFAAADGDPNQRLDALRARSPDNWKYKPIGNYILRVPGYVARQALVTAENHHVFLAEYLYCNKHTPLNPTRPVDFYFMPLRGLGQWRASADWLDVGIEGLDKNLRKVSAADIIRTLEFLYSQNVLDQMIASLDEDPSSRRCNSASPEAWRAFAQLYWADSIIFLREGRVVRDVSRDEQGRLVVAAEEVDERRHRRAVEPGQQPTPDSAVLSVGGISLSPEGVRRRTVALNLTAVREAVQNPEPEVLKALESIVGFDRVEYSCRLISRDGPATGLSRYLARGLYLVAEKELRRGREHALTLQQVQSKQLLSAFEVFSTLTHEIRSLFQKHFLNLRFDLERRPNQDVVDKTVHAWDLIHSAVEIAYLFAKGHTSPNEFGHEFANRFRKPLAQLRADGRLGPVVALVARRVYQLERPEGAPRVPIDGLEDQGLDKEEDLQLSPLDFVACYVLTAEPIRNLTHHGTEGWARWWLDETEGLEVVLEQSFPRHLHVPKSITFSALTKLIEGLGRGCSAGVQRTDDGTQLRWYVHLSKEFLEDEYETEVSADPAG